ncbi:hypothetical protein B7R21_07865 [Subtercola boreus]|uniref:DUF2254 domain-containing protein n=1 Tax=Subtercola boreus TaxID=120213 RepID=A0A3E0VVD4_9MICO|nr:DUF2254 domain-containing protein [Subtercola boreus]RFA13741.1 hypothetical protein B7R21_07865 [Subtercola boreus]
MRSRYSFILTARESFWFLPAVFGVVAIALGESLVLLDRSLIGNGVTGLFFLNALSASGGRSILSIIGTSMLTVAGTTFSITISVLATTSSTYGPRLVRNFMADRANQFVLAVFTSTFLYALVVLRSVHTQIDDNDSFVPLIAIHVAVLLAILDVAVLVFFIHHIADSVQITTLQRRVQKDLTATIDLVYPADAPSAGATVRSSADHSPISTVESASGGYVQRVDFDRLTHLASEHRVIVEVVAMPGTHVIAGEPLLRVIAAPLVPDPVKAVDDSFRAAFSLGSARTPYQDIRFALQQLVEIAVRGLASGSNDPYTAVSALDLSGESLVPLFTRPAPDSEIADTDGGIRVIRRWPQAEELISDVFAGVRTYGLEHPIVVEAALRLATRLRAVAVTPDRRRRITDEVEKLSGAYQSAKPDTAVLDSLRRFVSGDDQRIF